jgi:hypothetical protein
VLQGEHALQIVEVGTITETARGEIFIEPCIKNTYCDLVLSNILLLQQIKQDKVRTQSEINICRFKPRNTMYEVHPKSN